MRIFFTRVLGVAILFIGISTISHAQLLPVSNIYMFEFEEKSDSVFVFSNPKYLTAFNSMGYNNQPSFVGRSNLYFTVQFSDDTTQTDIFSVDFLAETLTQITATAESEYSAMELPRPTDELSLSKFSPRFSCVRVEMDGVSQRIWEFPLDRSTNGEPIFDDLTNVGYYLWVVQNALAIFQVGAPHNLSIVNRVSGRKKNITANIGRCFQPMPKGNMAFVHKLGNSWLIKELDPRTSRTTLLTGTLPGSEDFVALKDGTLIMGNGSKLYKFHKGIDSGWKEIADLSYYGIQNISRLAVKGKRIAIVNQQ